jgi:hypothetical protein
MNFKQMIEDAMVSADIAPSSALNMSKGGRGANAFYKYVSKNKKHPGKVGLYKQQVPKFAELLKRR